MPSKSTIVRFIQAAAPLGSFLAPGTAAYCLENLFLTPTRLRLRNRERDIMDQARQETAHLADGRAFPLYLWGQQGDFWGEGDLWGRKNAPTVLLVHGWAGRASQLAAFVEPLLKQGFRVAAFDAPAHGEAPGKQMSLPEMGDVVEACARLLGPLDSIVAHSLGAAGTTLALGRGLELRRVVYLAPPENPGEFPYRAAAYLGFSEEVAQRLQRRLEKRFDFRFAEGRGTFIGPKLRIPLLAVHDVDDKEVKYQESERLVKAWPGARLFSTHGLGHNRILRDKKVVAEAVGFLAARPLAIGSSGADLRGQDSSERMEMQPLKAA